MNNLKRFLALVLVLSMVLTAVPFGAFATESTGLVVDASESENNVNAVADDGVMPLAATTGTTSGQPFNSGTANSTLFRIPAITTLSNGDLVAAADARWNNAADHGNIDTLVSISKDNGTTWSYSFANYIADDGDSYNIQAATFIDPAMAVKTVDGVETIYMLVDLFPGQTNSYNCIANSLAGTGMDEKGHLLVSSTSATDLTAMDYYVGDFDDNNMATLYTSAGTDSSYDVDAWFNVYDSTGTELGNLFTYGDTDFYVYQTSYLYLTKSTDGGETWSAPTLINHQVKDSSEKFYGVGPASGIVTSDGTIMYTCYTWANGADGKTSTIYSRDNGVTWERGTELSSQSSEAALAEADGVVYLFNRYGQVCHTSDYGESWTYLSNSNLGYITSCEVSAMTYSKKIDGQTAILVAGPTVTNRYGGKIFVGLVNDDHSISWNYTYDVNSTSERFQYSSLTELADGSIGLLYENGDASILYTNLGIDTIVGEDAVVGNETKKITMYVGDTQTITLEGNQGTDNVTGDVADVTWVYSKENNTTTVTIAAKAKGTTTVEIGGIDYEITVLNVGEVLVEQEVDVELYVDESKSYTEASGGYTTAVVAPDETIVSMTLDPTTSDGDKKLVEVTSATFDAGKQYVLYNTRAQAILTDESYTSNAASWLNDGNALTGLKVSGEATADATELWIITSTDGGYTLSQDGKYVTFDNMSAAMSDTAEVLTFTYNANAGWFIDNAEGLHLSDLAGNTLEGAFGWHEADGSYWTIYEVAEDDPIVSTQVTFTGIQSGNATAVVGTTQYNIRVMNEGELAVTKEVDVELYVSETETITDTTGSYADSYTGSGLNTGIADVKVVSGVLDAAYELSDPVTAIESGKQYLIVCKRGVDGTHAAYDPTHSVLTDSAEGDGLAMNGPASGESTELWTIEKSGTDENTYTVTQNDSYLTVGNNTAAMITEETVLTLTYEENRWRIVKDGYYLSDLYGTGSTSAFGYNVENDDGNDWLLYEIVLGEPTNYTDITITGVSEGNTSVVVGETLYNITVKYVEKTLRVATGGTVTTESYGTVTDAQIAAFNEANSGYATVVKNLNGTLTFSGVAEGTVTEFVLGGAKYTVDVYAAPTCVDSGNTPFIVGGEFVGAGEWLTRLTMSSVITQENRTSDTGYYIQLSDAFADATDVSWSIEDESIAQIVPTDDGRAVYVYAADANTTGTTYLTVTIDGESYTMPVVIIQTTTETSESNWKYNSLHISEITNTTVWYSWNCSGDTGSFVEAIEGEAIWTVFATGEKYCINFYGAPDARHALTFMSATNSEGEYKTLADKADPTNCDFYNAGSGYDQRTGVGFTDEQVANDIAAATSLGCDGAQGFSRAPGANGVVNCDLTFISDPMPQLDKTIAGILPTTRKQADFRRYSDGMVASVGELVYFTLTVTLERPNTWANNDEAAGIGAITYSAAELVDHLETAYFYTKELDMADSADTATLDGVVTEENQTNLQEITEALNEKWGDEEVRTLTYYVLYEIKKEDIPKFTIDNVADLTWDYQSTYSSGKLDATANALASITVVGKSLDNVVIDFGQTVQYTGLTDEALSGVYTGDNVKFNANHGDVDVTKEDDGTYTVTYTPTSILLAPDTVQLYGQFTDDKDTTDPSDDETYEKVINGFTVYPATTVYYEEGFMFNDAATGWTGTGAKATAVQTFEKLGEAVYDTNSTLTGYQSDKVHPYGYDPIYANDTVEKSSASTTTPKAKTTFTFTGNGFEVFADSTTSTGTVSVQVQNSKGAYVKVFTVNTVAREGYTDVTTGQTADLYSLPIVSWHSETHDTYTVTIQKVMNNADPVVLDGVRIFNTIDESKYVTEENEVNSPFKIDLEDNPDFYQLRDHVLYALEVDADTSIDYKTMRDQVYELLGENQSAVILTEENPYTGVALLDGTVYTKTTTKTTVIKTEYTDGTYVVVTRVDTVLEEYSDAERTNLILTRTYTEDSTEYYAADGNKVDREAFGDVTKKTVASRTANDPVEVTVEGQKTVNTSQDLLDNGPKNELYLHKGERLVFKVSTNRMMQIGLKAPQGSASYSLAYTMNDGDAVTVADNAALNTSVDLFYELGNAIGTEQTYTITITNHGSELLSVTDLKICDDPNAVFTPLTEADIEAVMLDMGYSASCAAGHTYENGFCTVCGMGSVQNTTTGVEYGTVGEALAAAQDGETVILLTDCTESTAMVTPGVTLDLNGFKLTASYAVAMDGAHIIDSMGSGSLATGEKALILDEENAMIPVYNGEGYVFTKAGFAIRQDSAYTGEGIKIQALAYPVQMAVVDLLKDGGADNNVEIVIRLTWDTAEGTGSQDFKFTDEVVSSVYSSNNGTFAGYSKMFSMVVTGFESIENLKANIILVSDTDVKYVSSTSVDIT